MGTETTKNKLILKNEEEYEKSQGVTQAKYARMRGVQRQAINKHVKNGVITLLENGKIDPETADRELRENLNPGASHIKLPAGVIPENKDSGTGNPEDTFRRAKTVEKGYHAKLAELTYKEKTGELVKSKDVERAHFNLGRKVRDNMLNIPDRIVAQLVSLFGLDVSPENTNKGRDIIVKEIEKALQAI